MTIDKPEPFSHLSGVTGDSIKSFNSIPNNSNVILLSVDPEMRNVLAGISKNLLRFFALTKVRQMYDHIEQNNEPIDALVLGVQLEEPVRIAQRIHSMGKDIPLLILTEPERHEQLKQALKFAPFLGKDIIPCSTHPDELIRLPEVLLDTVKRAQKRRTYRGSIAAAQKCLSNVKREPPQVTHYLDRLLDHAPIGVLNVDIQGSILGLNRRAGQILKCTEREVLGHSLMEIVPSSEHVALRDMIAQCVAPARQRAPEVIDMSKSIGIVRYVEVMASSLVDRSGQLGATLILQDVTARVRAEQERSQAEEALRISERRYRELVQTMSEALALTDSHHNITYVNDSFCRMFDFSCDEVIGKPLLQFVHEDDQEIMRERMLLPTQDNTIERFETAWKTKNGRKVFTLTSPKRIFDPQVGYVGCLGVFTDITERKQIEAREKQHMMELYHASRVTTIGEMSSQVAHELAQPLSAIAALSTGCLKMLNAQMGSDKDIKEALTDINEQSKRAREIVVRLRNFVRYEEMQSVSFELNELVRTVVHLVEAETRWHNLAVNLELQELLPTTKGDRILIEQVVMNLVRNAIEAMQQSQQRQLTIRTANLENDVLQVEVIDTGSGISDTELKQIFEPFFTTKSNGMGMGLAITRSIIDAHGGCLNAKRNEPLGMSFCFTLPIENQEAVHEY